MFTLIDVRFIFTSILWAPVVAIKNKKGKHPAAKAPIKRKADEKPACDGE